MSTKKVSGQAGAQARGRAVGSCHRNVGMIPDLPVFTGDHNRHKVRKDGMSQSRTSPHRLQQARQRRRRRSAPAAGSPRRNGMRLGRRPVSAHCSHAGGARVCGRRHHLGRQQGRRRHLRRGSGTAPASPRGQSRRQPHARCLVNAWLVSNRRNPHQ